jgi:cathepsin B
MTRVRLSRLPVFAVLLLLTSGESYSDDDYSYSSDDSAAYLPTSFEFPTGDVMDQGGCGSCYAFAASQVFSDRTNYNSNTNIIMSPQTMVSCDYNYQPPSSMPDSWEGGGREGCFGGLPIVMFDFIKQYAQGTCSSSSRQLICTTGCAAYVSGWSADGRMCATTDDDYAMNCDAMPACSTYASCKSYSFSGTPGCLPHDGSSVSETHMMEEIYNHGTVSVSIWANADNFMNFWSRNPKVVYKKSDMPGAAELDHAVVVVGWGTSYDGTPYWKVKNTWADAWGDNGYFYVERGKNVLGIEEEVCSCPPATDSYTRNSAFYSLRGRVLAAGAVANTTNAINATKAVHRPNVTRGTPGAWFVDNASAPCAVHTANHVALQSNHSLEKVQRLHTQIVAGKRHLIEFETLSQDGQIYTNHALVWAQADGNIIIQQHKKAPRSSTLSVGVIAGCVAGVCAVAMVAALAVRRRRAARSSTQSSSATKDGTGFESNPAFEADTEEAGAAVPADSTNAL